MAKVFEVDTDETLLTALQAYYACEDVNDSSVNGRNLVARGNASFVAGKVNNAVDVDGTDDYLDGGDILDFDNNQSWSVSCWFNLATISRSSGLVTKYDDTNDKGWGVYVSSDNRIRVFMNSSASNGFQRRTTSVVVSVSTWYHLVVTYNGATGAQQIFINNSNQALTSELTNLSASTLTAISFNLGSFNDGHFADADGLIDEVGIWSKVLSAQEITDLYNGGDGQTMIEGGESNIKSINGLLRSSVKSINGLAIASVKSVNGLA